MIHARCFVHVFLGASDEKRHFHRAQWVEDKAKEMGCVVFKTHEMSMNDINQKMKDVMGKYKFDPAKDKLHISYVDHGSDGSLPYGGSWESYQTTLSSLDFILPKGTDVTFSSQICWPGFHEGLHKTKFKNIKSMCGASSVDIDHLSNAWGGDSDWAREHEYLSSGWSYWANEYDTHEGNDFLQAFGFDAEDKEEGHKHTNLYNFHYQNIKNDMNNLVRGSSLTSLNYARTRLKELGDYETFKQPGINSINQDLNFNLYNASSKVLGQKNSDETCVSCTYKKMSNLGLDQFYNMNGFANELKNKAIQTEIDKLAAKNSQYKAFADMYRRNFDYIRKNESALKEKVAIYLIKLKKLKAQIQNASNLSNFSQEKEFQEEYESLKEEMDDEFEDLYVMMRQANDVEMIVKLKEKDPASLKKFESYMACERRNALDHV